MITLAANYGCHGRNTGPEGKGEIPGKEHHEPRGHSVTTQTAGDNGLRDMVRGGQRRHWGYTQTDSEMIRLKPLYDFKMETIALSLIVMVGAHLSLLAWGMGFNPLIRMVEEWSAIKAPASALFMVAGVALYVMALGTRSTMQMVTISFLSQFIIFVCSCILVISAFEVQLSILFATDQEFVISPNMPSLMGLVMFISSGMAGMVWLFNTERACRRLKIIGLSMGLVSFVCLLGYRLDIPFLYYQFAPISAGMSPITALLIVPLGAGYWCLGEGMKYHCEHDEREP